MSLSFSAMGKRFRKLYESVKEKFDGCTAVPDFDFGETCCNRHDFDYLTKRVTRAEADLKFYRCVKRSGKPIIAAVYYVGVRLFGWYFWNRKKDK